MIHTFHSLMARVTPLIGVLFMVACTQRQTHVAHQDAPVHEMSVAHTRPAPRDIPLVYQQRIVPAPLTSAQLRRIHETPDLIIPPGREVWFIQVRRNHVETDRWEWSGIAYFKPGIATGRLRRGKRAFVGDSSEDAPLYRIVETLGDKHELIRPLMEDYVQVSDSNMPFGDRLTTPDATLLPFAVPENMTNAEIVEIVDFARTATPPGTDTTWKWAKDHKRPILELEKNDDTIEVKFGWREGSLAGGGHLLRMKRVGDHLEVVGVAVWYS